MFSTTLKQSVATLGVVAGLLAAAVPASAMPAGASPIMPNDALKAGASEVSLMETNGDQLFITAPTNAGTQVGSEGAKAPTKTDEQLKDNVKAAVVLNGANAYGWTEGNNTPYDDGLGIRGDAQDARTSRTSSLKDTMVSGYNVKADAEGTQVGSEGVKAPTTNAPLNANDREAHVPMW